VRVIASEAKQSGFPNQRAIVERDCFASLAMTQPAYLIRFSVAPIAAFHDTIDVGRAILFAR
jgi:hypothetical protein